VSQPGIVVKAWSNWYTVATESARLLCRPRGRLKRGADVRVGDRVEVTALEGGEGVIEDVAPRRNRLDRPPVANVDLVAVVSAWTAPPWSPELADRILVRAAAAGCRALLVINKADLLEDPTAVRRGTEPYRRAGYPVLLTSALTGEGLDLLARAADGGVVCLAGQSGAGKTRLLAALAPDRALRSGALSERLGHGRHTTRHAELLPVGGGWIVDTPGFSRLDMDGIEPAALGRCFPEVAALAAGCRFRSCLHRSEPGCAVRGAVDPGRYARYLRLLEECERQPLQVAARSRRPRPAGLDGDEDDEDGGDGEWEP
jgi:ribosome biogenesis GTPase